MKPAFLKNQKGLAMFVAVMILSLGTSVAFLAFQVATTELSIARYSEGESQAVYLAESGVEKVMSWISNPPASPNPAFFKNLPSTPCSGTLTNPGFPKSAQLAITPFSDFASYLADTASGPFSELSGLGKITQIQLYAPVHAQGLCTVEVTAATHGGAGTKIRVHIAKNPLGKITAGIQGHGIAGNAFPVRGHWGEIRYTGRANFGSDIRIVPALDSLALPNSAPYDPVNHDVNIDPFLRVKVEQAIFAPLPDNGDSYISRPNAMQNQGTAAALDALDFERIKSFIKKQGEYYTVSEDGQHLLKNGQHLLDEHGNHVDSVDAVFHGKTDQSHLVWIENAGKPAHRISEGRFKGHFYFSGGISIEGDVPGRTVTAHSPKVLGYPEGVQIELPQINLEGLFAAKEKIHLQRVFRVYGAIYSIGGYTGPGGAELELWYNAKFSQGIYADVRPVIPLAGTWLNPSLAESF